MINNLISRDALSEALLGHIDARCIRDHFPETAENALHGCTIEAQMAINDLIRRPWDTFNRDTQVLEPLSAKNQKPLPTEQRSWMKVLSRGSSRERGRHTSMTETNTYTDQRWIMLFGPRTSSHKSPSWLQYLGFSGSVVHKTGYQAEIFSVSIRYRPPAVWSHRRILILMDFAFHLTSNSWRISGRNLTPLNTVQDEAEIIQACKHGYVEVVRRLFHTNVASIKDITCTNKSLLYVSIPKS